MSYQRTRAGFLRTVKFTLPAYWASALINSDNSGMSDEDEVALNQWLDAHLEIGPVLSCSDESEFRAFHDAPGLACDCLVYTFPLLERVATLVPMQREVRKARRTKLLSGYIVQFEGRESMPPVSRSEAYKLAREMGATKVEVQ